MEAIRTSISKIRKGGFETHLTGKIRTRNPDMGPGEGEHRLNPKFKVRAVFFHL